MTVTVVMIVMITVCVFPLVVHDIVESANFLGFASTCGSCFL